LQKAKMIQTTKIAVKAPEKLLESIQQPVTDAEARVLIDLFGGPDSCFGFSLDITAFDRIHAKLATHDFLLNTGNPWIRRLKRRIENAD
jgi:hypothetical protein